MESSISVPEHEIYEDVFGYAKIYPNSTKLILYDKPIKVRIAGFEERKPRKLTKRKTETDKNTLFYFDSLRRTKTKIADLVQCNRFDLWCTFTFNCSPCPANRQGEQCTNDGDEGCVCDPDTCKRYDVNFLKKRMSIWLSNQNQHVGKFEYLIVPEFHKDGKAIHFHAFFKGYKGELLPTKLLTERGQRIHNISEYHFGWSTAIYLADTDEDRAKTASYVRKYIHKDMPQFGGKKRYWVSQGLIRPKKVRNPIMFPYLMGDKWRENRMAGATFKITDERVDFVSGSDRGKLLQ